MSPLIQQGTLPRHAKWHTPYGIHHLAVFEKSIYLRSVCGGVIEHLYGPFVETKPNIA